MVDGKTIGAVLRAHRVRTGLTQEQLAERSGVSVRAIGDLERDRVARPHRESVRLLAEALGLDGDDGAALMCLAGHGVSAPAPEQAGAAEDGPDLAGPVAPVVSRAGCAVSDPPAGEVGEVGRAGEVGQVGQAEEACVDGGLPSPPGAALRLRRALRAAVIAAAAACLVIAGVVLWPGPSGRSGAVVSPDGSGYVGRVAADAQIVSSAGAELRVDHPVTSGDALVVALMLTSTTAGTVAVTDTAGNHYDMVADVTDPFHHRTALFAALRVSPLRAGDRLTITWPQASKHHIAVDEFHGISAAMGQAAGFGTYDHGDETVAAGITAGCGSGDLVIAAVGSNSGPAPALAPGWLNLPELRLSSYRLAVAFRRATAHDGCTLTGTSQAQWETALVSLRLDEPSR